MGKERATPQEHHGLHRRPERDGPDGARNPSWLINPRGRGCASSQRWVKRLHGQRKAKQMFTRAVLSVLLTSMSINSNTFFLEHIKQKRGNS